MGEREEYTPPMDEIKRWYSGAVGEYRCDTGMSEEDGEPSYYEPVPQIVCTRCGVLDADLFPGTSREWEW